MKVNQFLETIKESYVKEFPNSKIIAKVNKGLGTSIYIKCYLAGSKEELYNGIAQNDMFNITFWMHEQNENISIEGELPENLYLECTEKSYLIKPDTEYMCYGRRKLSYRKIAGAEKIINSLDKFFKKLRLELEKDIENNNIHDNHINLLKEKLI